MRLTIAFRLLISVVLVSATSNDADSLNASLKNALLEYWTPKPLSELKRIGKAWLDREQEEGKRGPLGNTRAGGATFPVHLGSASTDSSNQKTTTPLYYDPTSVALVGSAVMLIGVGVLGTGAFVTYRIQKHRREEDNYPQLDDYDDTSDNDGYGSSSRFRMCYRTPSLGDDGRRSRCITTARGGESQPARMGMYSDGSGLENDFDVEFQGNAATDDEIEQFQNPDGDIFTSQSARLDRTRFVDDDDEQWLPDHLGDRGEGGWPVRGTQDGARTRNVQFSDVQTQIEGPYAAPKSVQVRKKPLE